MLNEYGYAALFFAFCLGIVGLPIPNEVVVMTGGAASSEGMLLPVPAFLMTYGGICCGLTVGFVVGRFVGVPILERLGRRPKFDAYVARSQRLVEKYGGTALLFTYFIPVVRNVIPYVIGAGGVRFPMFALFAYSGAFVWTAIFFIVGYLTGNEINDVFLLIQ